MFYRKAVPYDTTAIKKLWEEVFGDLGDYISRFIAHFGIECGYVCEINREIVAMSFAITTEFSVNKMQKFSHSKNQRVKYIYACATHPNHREQGIMQRLLETIYEDACREEVVGLFLQAASLSLSRYYQKLGFEDFFYRDHSFFYKQEKNKKASLPKFDSIDFILPETYHEKRVQKLANICFIDWNKDFFRFLNENGTQFCEYENTIFTYKTMCNNIIVDEWLGDTPQEHIAQLLFKHLPDFEVVIIRSIGSDFCCGQIRWCHSFKNQQEKGWLGFAME